MLEIFTKRGAAPKTDLELLQQAIGSAASEGTNFSYEEVAEEILRINRQPTPTAQKLTPKELDRAVTLYKKIIGSDWGPEAQKMLYFLEAQKPEQQAKTPGFLSWARNRKIAFTGVTKAFLISALFTGAAIVDSTVIVEQYAQLQVDRQYPALSRESLKTASLQNSIACLAPEETSRYIERIRRQHETRRSLVREQKSQEADREILDFSVIFLGGSFTIVFGLAKLAGVKEF